MTTDELAPCTVMISVSAPSVEKSEAIGITIVPLRSEFMTTVPLKVPFTKSEVDRWKAAMKNAGVQPQ